MINYIKALKLSNYSLTVYLLLASVLMAVSGCENVLDTRVDTKTTDEVLESSNTSFINLGYSA